MGEKRREPLPPTKVVKNLRHLIAIIESRGLEPELANEVKKAVKEYPEGALEFAFNNMDNIIIQAQNKLSARNTIQIQQPEVKPAEIIKKVEEPIVKRKPLFEEEND